MLSLQYLLIVLLSQLQVHFCFMVCHHLVLGPKSEVPERDNCAFFSHFLHSRLKKVTIKNDKILDLTLFPKYYSQI